MKDTAETFHTLAKDRFSVRRFRDTPVARSLIERVLHTAVQAPSAHNRQPWRFVVLTTRGNRELLAAAMGERLRADRTADGDSTAAIERDLAGSWMRITNAPAVIILCLTMEDMDRYGDGRRDQAEEQMAVQSVAMAGQNLLLAAHAEGLGACWMCAPLFAPEEVRRAFDLPERWEPQGLILLGYPQDAGRKRTRRRVDEVTQWR